MGSSNVIQSGPYKGCISWHMADLRAGVAGIAMNYQLWTNVPLQQRYLIRKIRFTALLYRGAPAAQFPLTAIVGFGNSAIAGAMVDYPDPAVINSLALPNLFQANPNFFFTRDSPEIVEPNAYLYQANQGWIMSLVLYNPDGSAFVITDGIQVYCDLTLERVSDP